MKNEKLRNVAIIAHVDHGKTSLLDPPPTGAPRGPSGLRGAPPRGGAIRKAASCQRLSSQSRLRQGFACGKTLVRAMRRAPSGMGPRVALPIS